MMPEGDTPGPNLSGPVVLLIIDGMGLCPSTEGNALLAASTPHLCEIDARYIGTRLSSSGDAVGLRPGQMGNSNVGHLHLGAGRIVPQDGLRIDRAISDGSIFNNPELSRLMDQTRKSGATLHIMGLVSDGRVHSDLRHLFALLTMARRRAVGNVAVHAFLDGRDVSPGTAPKYLSALEEQLRRSPDHRLATISGRYYAMDRDRRWDRLDLALAAILRGEGRRAGGVREAIEAWSAAGESDEFVLPTVLGGYSGVDPDDTFLTFNYRADRMRELVGALSHPGCGQVDTSPLRRGVRMVTMTRYDPEFSCPAAFELQDIPNTLGEVVSRARLRQLRLAETEKYAHVTYFFNGGREQPYPGEDRVLVPSPKVDTYDTKPEMSAREVTDRLVEAIVGETYHFVVANYANPDMVGHTGDFAAAVSAVETIDGELGRILAALREAEGVALILSDHGNVEKMINDSGAHTAHTAHEVPCWLVGEGFLRGGSSLLRRGGLSDAAPTILDLLGLEVPREMTGKGLLAASDGGCDIWRGDVLDGCRE
ncbi:MAG: 2,3-bisphosphoglycerate-independent phosphoglycerate mutase [Clostridia bacterium]